MLTVTELQAQLDDLLGQRTALASQLQELLIVQHQLEGGIRCCKFLLGKARATSQSSGACDLGMQAST